LATTNDIVAEAMKHPEHIGTILQRAVNLNWGDDDWQMLYFTGPTTLHRIRLNIPGIPVPRGAV